LGRANELGQSREVRAHFAATADYWQDLYERADVAGIVFQDRQEAALEMVARLDLPLDGPVLEVGCGAGFLTADLARRGFMVTAVDAAPEMLALARDRVDSSGVGQAVRLLQADVHALEFPDSGFDLVMALGVIPWLHSPSSALAELSRVLRPGGHLVVTSDNRARLNHLADPSFSPALAWLRSAVSAARRSLTHVQADTRFHPHLLWTWRFRSLIQAAGLEVIEERTVGFGPFSFLAHPLLSGRAGVALHHRFQALANRRLPLFRSTGSHHIVLARKPSAANP